MYNFISEALDYKLNYIYKLRSKKLDLNQWLWAYTKFKLYISKVQPKDNLKHLL